MPGRGVQNGQVSVHWVTSEVLFRSASRGLPHRNGVNRASSRSQRLKNEPRSTRSHCGSPKALDQRVAALPSTAAEAGVPAFSADDAVTGLPWDSSGSATAWAAPAPLSGR